MTRRLAAIVATDIVAYSVLMRSDEDGTLHAVEEVIASVLRPLASLRNGHVAKTLGDGALLVFDSASDAVSFAVEFQRKMAESAPLVHGTALRARIGINLGDIVFQDGDIFGDGVNLATRLEGEAPVGGICVAGTVRDQVRDRLAVHFDAMGDLELKNIDRPVPAFAVDLGRTASELPASSKPMARRYRRLGVRRIALGLGIALALVLGGTVAWYQLPDTAVTVPTDLGERTSLAVLPFTTPGPPADAQYFADGLARDIVAALSRFDELLVISSNSSFAYRDRDMSLDQIGADLSAGYLIIGDLRRQGDRVRITVELLRTADGQAVWAERFEATGTDLFAVQDELVAGVVRTLVIGLEDAEIQRTASVPPDSLAAYEHLLRGRALAVQFTRTSLFDARAHYRRALELDPDYSAALAELGFTYFQAVTYGWSATPNPALTRAADLARKSLAIDSSNTVAHRLLGRILQFRGNYEAGLEEAEAAVALNPNDPDSLRDLGVVRLWSGHAEEAIAALEVSLRFDPRMGAEGLFHLGLAYYLTGRYADAIELLRRSIERNPDFSFSYMVIAASFAKLGKTRSAARMLAELRQRDPFFRVEDAGRSFRDEEDAMLLIEGLRIADSEEP